MMLESVNDEPEIRSGVPPKSETTEGKMEATTGTESYKKAMLLAE